MEISQIIPHVEALIFAADRPLPMLEIVDLLNNALAFLEDRATLDQVEAAMEAIQEKYGSEFYAFEVRASGGGYQFLTKKDYYQTVAQLNGDKFIKRLSTAALETLAIIAYRQPISKGEIEHIRGVSTDYSIQKLLEKELIVISGRSEELPGKPLLYATSKVFMDYFGLNSTADLPKLKELFDEDAIQPTLINDDTATIGRDDEKEAVINGALVISEDGELIEQEEIILEETTEIPTETPEEAASESEEVEPDDTAPLMESALIAEEIGGRADEPAPEEEDEADAPPKEHKVTRGDGEPDDITEKRFEEELEDEALQTELDKTAADKEKETPENVDEQDDDEAELKFEEEEEEEEGDEDLEEDDDDDDDDEDEEAAEEDDENDEDDKDKDDDKKQDH